jgi:S-adenosylmethionine decarboxylase
MDCFEHFIKEAETIYVGNHLIVDLWGIINHSDPNTITDVFRSACQDAGATVLFSHCHPFGPNAGTTGVIVLAESHLSWHHYPEVHMISIDIFMCGSADPQKAMPKINSFWNPSYADMKNFRRGCVEEHKLPNKFLQPSR